MPNSYFYDFWLVELLTFCSGSGLPLLGEIVTSNSGAWLRNTTLRFCNLTEQCHTHEILIWQKNENNKKNEDKFKYYSDLKNEDDLQNWGNPKRKSTSKMKITSNMKKNEDELKNDDIFKICPPNNHFAPPLIIRSYRDVFNDLSPWQPHNKWC